MRKAKGTADDSPLSKNRMGQLLRVAASALDHGRLTTACENVARVHSELNGITFTGDINNSIRADYGARSVAAGDSDYKDTIKGENGLASSVTYTLANIMHLCRREGIDFAERLDFAEIQFEEEACRTNDCPNDSNDGEGFDGYCGDCADKREKTNV